MLSGLLLLLLLLFVELLELFVVVSKTISDLGCCLEVSSKQIFSSKELLNGANQMLK
jgi:hypothetical protein